MQEFVLGNLDTKFLVMTHDMMTFINIYDINEDINNLVKDKYIKTTSLQLKNKSWLLYDLKLEEYQEKNANEYSRLFYLVYSFIKESTPSSSFPIGNIMRQLMEAFATFQYKIGISDLSTKKEILNLLPDDYKEYFKNYMYRLVLNGGSHKEDETKFNLGMNFQNLYTLDEIRRTAKHVLCFLYLLNKEHVIAHMRDKGNNVINRQIENDLNVWCNEIKNIAQ